MTLYGETSAILRWLFAESGADEILELLRGAGKVVCSRLTIIESHRVIRRVVTLGDLVETDAVDVRSILAQAAARWAMFEISPEVGRRAEEAFPVEPVRTLDALHLATALVLRQAIPDLRMLSTDARVRENAVALGFDVLPAE
ncbi:MAG: hypothetical protein QOD06_1676 [Candidatus Binatota bacterium]|nr:hypothetical protein [Candidatus Binatota bacterium]